MLPTTGNEEEGGFEANSYDGERILTEVLPIIRLNKLRPRLAKAYTPELRLRVIALTASISERYHNTLNSISTIVPNLSSSIQVMIREIEPPYSLQATIWNPLVPGNAGGDEE